MINLRPEDITYAVKILNKYRDIHPVDLMDDIYERIQALLLKIADMNEEESEELALFDTLETWLNDVTQKLIETKNGIRKIRSQSKN